MDPAAVQSFALEVWRSKQGELVALMLSLGDRLGLFDALADQGVVSSDRLADATGLAERPLREWLYGMSAAGLVEHDDGRFGLSAVAVPVLVDERTSPFYAVGAFAMRSDDELEPTLSLMRTGRGGGFDALGTHTLEALERMTGPVFRTVLPGVVVPASGIDTTGATRVADVGCGTGLSTVVLAEAMPHAEVLGVDPSSAALGRAHDRAGDRVAFVEGVAEQLPEHGTFDVVTAFDCLHDMPRPDLGLAACREALEPGGTMIVKEPRSSGDFERDRRNPLLALNYGFSLTGCLQSGLSTEDGWGLGNTGLHPARLESLAHECGFDLVTHLDVPDPAATYTVLA